MRRALLSVLLSPLIAVIGSRATAQGYEYEQPSAREIVVAYNTGFRVTIAPGVFIPTDGGKVGFSLAGDFRYGFELGPTVLAPGVRLAGYFPDQQNVLVALATARMTFPVGPVGPFVVAGAGPGYVTSPGETSLAYLAGGGFMVHIGMRFGIGAEATYQAITGTEFAALFVGPSLLLAF
jgi:hypothetical protein